MSLEQVNLDLPRLKRVLLANGFGRRLVASIETRALRSGRRLTGVFRSNRHSRWELIFNHPDHGTDPQYGTEEDCKQILIILLLGTLEFRNAPIVTNPVISELSERYLGRALIPGSYRDSLLLEYLDFEILRSESENPVHGRSSFHIGHQDPNAIPKHSPNNVAWRTLRSNLIQGDMTLREARIYIIKLIGRYFELGELNIEN